jgi:hypothetical protein
MKELVMLMTACIAPSAETSGIVRRDANTRLGDYATALEFWLRLDEPQVRGIVFVENSGFPLDEIHRVVSLANVHQRKVEILQSSSNWCPPGMHYGWAELAMVDKALSESKLLARADYFAKVTGRLRFPQFSGLLRSLPPEFLFAVDCRNNRWFVSAPQVFVTTQCMIFSNRFYRDHLLNTRHELKSGTLIENFLYEKLTPFAPRSGAILRWSCNCDPRGIGAHWNKDYGSPKQRLICGCRGLARRILPTWWV